LGVVTAASLKLFAVPASRATAIAGLAGAADAVTLLARAKQESAGGIEAFELMGRLGVSFALRHIPGLREPLEQQYPWYVLIEAISSEPGGAEAALERLLTQGLEDGLVQDAAIAQNQAQAKAFWRLREDQSAAQKPEGLSWKHDVSVPVSKVADLIERAGVEIGRRWPRARIAAFGHVGDGNIHYNISEPEGGDPAFEADREACARLVHDIVHDLGGSISAEHGLGVMKSDEALHYKSAVEIEAMRAVRQALDPKRIMNPRVLF
jgi:FAD/FMN-containing dehydrogenase